MQENKKHLLCPIDPNEDVDIQKKLEFLLTSFGGDPSKVMKAYLINNPSLIRMFEEGRRIITQKHQDSQQLFKKNDWMDAPDSSQKLAFIKHLSQTILKFRSQWNDGSKVLSLSFLLPSSLSWLTLF